jgi:acetyltransferase-like isoleucine patch superfamily enzyme
MGLDLFNRFFNKLAFLVPGGDSLRPQLQRRRGVTIGNNVWISQYVYFDELHPEGITIGDNVTIGLRTTIFTHFYWGPKRSEGGYKKVIIEDDVFIGPHCLILPGVRIRQGAVIKGGTTVTRDVPANAFIGLPEPRPIAHASVPLTRNYSYDEFISGLRPFRKQKPTKAMK